MRIAISLVKPLFAVLILTACAHAGAQQREPAGSTQTGRVERIYVKESHNFFIETRIAGATRGRERWSEVAIRAPQPGKPAREIVQIPHDVKVAVGDIVELTVAERDEFQIAPVQEVSRIVKLIAPSDSHYAAIFGGGAAPLRPAVLRLPSPASD